MLRNVSGTVSITGSSSTVATRSRPGLSARTGSSSSSTRSSRRSAVRCAEAIVSLATPTAEISSRTALFRSVIVRGSWASASVCACSWASSSERPGMRGMPSPRNGSTSARSALAGTSANRRHHRRGVSLVPATACPEGGGPRRREISMTAPQRSRRTRWGCGAVAATVAATGLLGIAAAGSAQAAPAAGWAATATHALQPTSAVRLGAAPASTPLRLTVGLAPRDRAGLDALIRRQATPGAADYGRYLTPAPFTPRVAATPATASAVASYLTSQGMTGVTVAPNRLQVTADATVAEAQRAFATSIAQFRQGGRTILANTTDALVPADLAGEVTGVLGLSSLGATLAPTPAAPSLDGFYPKQFATVYHAGSTLPGTNTTLAVIAEGNLAPTIKDLRTAEAKQGLRQIPVNLVHAGPASADTAGVDEWDLDTQTSTGVAPNAKSLTVYIATSLTNSDLARAINRFASDGTAKSGSASLGECDVLPFLDGSMMVDDIALAQAAAQGQTFFASTGDTGSSCAVAPTNGVPLSGLPDTEYPASSPYAVAVGGTTLLASSSGAYISEAAWNAGGGGASPVENSGAWQSGVVPTAAANVRGLPDVAFDADPNTGALIYVNGTPEQIGGTSLSSPLAMGLWTRIQATHGGHLGFVSPKLYGYYVAKGGTAVPPATVAGFHDVILGSNGTYVATPGWDYTTGLGSWDVAALSNSLH